MDTKHSENTGLLVCDNLNLVDMAVPYIPENIIFPDELNSYLRDRLQYLIHENGMLKKNLCENEEVMQKSQSKIDELNNKLEEFNTSKSYVTASNVASSKIVELSKKLREKNSEVEVLKTKCSKLEKIISHLNKQQSSQIQTEPQKEPEPVDEYESQIKNLQDKLNSISTKLFEVKNSNIQLKNDLKFASKLLQQEVGESFETLRSVANCNSNWRGRAQIICDLQQKNNELKEKLKLQQVESKTTIGEPKPLTRADKRLDVVTKENLEIKQTLDETKRKLEGSKARCRVLESEINALKAKVCTVSEQHERDSELINTLMARISNVRDDQNNKIKEKERLIQKLQQNNNSLQVELTKEKCKIENLQANAGYRALESNSASCNSFTTIKPENDRIINHLEVEKTRLLELVDLLKKKLDTERDSHTNTQILFRNERQKTAKLESKIARLQVEHSDKGSSQSSYSLQNLQKQSRNNTQEQLELAEEQIKALQTRLEIEKRERELDFQEFSKILRTISK